VSRARKDGVTPMRWWSDWVEDGGSYFPPAKQDGCHIDLAARRYAHRRNAEARKAARRPLPRQYPTDT